MNRKFIIALLIVVTVAIFFIYWQTYGQVTKYEKSVYVQIFQYENNNYDVAKFTDNLNSHVSFDGVTFVYKGNSSVNANQCKNGHGLLLFHK